MNERKHISLKSMVECLLLKHEGEGLLLLLAGPRQWPAPTCHLGGPVRVPKSPESGPLQRRGQHAPLSRSAAHPGLTARRRAPQLLPASTESKARTCSAPGADSLVQFLSSSWSSRALGSCGSGPSEPPQPRCARHLLSQPPAS